MLARLAMLARSSLVSAASAGPSTAVVAASVASPVMLLRQVSSKAWCVLEKGKNDWLID